ncbi:hypothetical protein PIB30_075530 [Stylosanthes scabra]|uniref:Uncharacterized protein n=1 Tax=Stylosanthes scabra TaxID=79078 RepID=A0ABU6RQB4_9FABA|nr:hypothetical protein [Stylosanthes scabra]
MREQPEDRGGDIGTHGGDSIVSNDHCRGSLLFFCSPTTTAPWLRRRQEKLQQRWRRTGTASSFGSGGGDSSNRISLSLSLRFPSLSASNRDGDGDGSTASPRRRRLLSSFLQFLRVCGLIGD